MDFNTIRELALHCEDETLELETWSESIARLMQSRVRGDVEPHGCIIWIVGEPSITWAVAMPGRAWDLEAIRG